MQESEAQLTRIGPGYFKTMEIPMLAGRDFTAQDTRSTQDVAIVNQAFANTFFPNQNPIGRTFQTDFGPGDRAPQRLIVGIVKNSKYHDLHAPFGPVAFLASAQSPELPRDLLLVIRSRMPEATVKAAVTRALGEINPGISLTFDTMDSQIDRSLQRDRLMAFVSGFFGALAALIATIGLYGVMSYIVARRRTEIGIRMALGAAPGAVVRLIAREAGLLVIIGLMAGGVLAVIAARSAQALLFELQPWDPKTLALSAIGLGAVAALASWLPARRAARLDPTQALRQE
jgi:predicted permease